MLALICSSSSGLDPVIGAGDAGDVSLRRSDLRGGLLEDLLSGDLTCARAKRRKVHRRLRKLQLLAGSLSVCANLRRWILVHLLLQLLDSLCLCCSMLEHSLLLFQGVHCHPATDNVLLDEALVDEEVHLVLHPLLVLDLVFLSFQLLLHLFIPLQFLLDLQLLCSLLQLRLLDLRLGPSWFC